MKYYKNILLQKLLGDYKKYIFILTNMWTTKI